MRGTDNYVSSSAELYTYIFLRIKFLRGTDDSQSCLQSAYSNIF